MSRSKRLLALAVTAAVIGGGLGLATASGSSNTPETKTPVVRKHQRPRVHTVRDHYCPFRQSNASTATDL